MHDGPITFTLNLAHAYSFHEDGGVLKLLSWACSLDAVRQMKPMEDPDASLPFIREILSTLRQNVGDASTVLGFIGTPWTLAAYAMEGQADRCSPAADSTCIKRSQKAVSNASALAGARFCPVGSARTARGLRMDTCCAGTACRRSAS